MQNTLKLITKIIISVAVLVPGQSAHAQKTWNAITSWQAARADWEKVPPTKYYQIYYENVIQGLKPMFRSDLISTKQERAAIINRSAYGISAEYGKLNAEDPGGDLLQSVLTNQRSPMSLSAMEVAQLNKYVYPVVADETYSSWQKGGIQLNLRENRYSVFYPFELIEKMEKDTINAWNNSSMAIILGRADEFNAGSQQIIMLNEKSRFKSNISILEDLTKQISTEIHSCNELKMELTANLLAFDPSDISQWVNKVEIINNCLNQYNKLDTMKNTDIYTNITRELANSCRLALNLSANPSLLIMDSKLKYGAIIKFQSTINVNLKNINIEKLMEQVKLARAFVQRIEENSTLSSLVDSKLLAKFNVSINFINNDLNQLNQIANKISNIHSIIENIIYEVAKADAAKAQFKRSTIPLYKEKYVEALRQAKDYYIQLKPIRDHELDLTVKDRLNRKIRLIPTTQGTQLTNSFYLVYK